MFISMLKFSPFSFIVQGFGYGSGFNQVSGSVYRFGIPDPDPGGRK
jgi:hypothetical protein